MKQEFLNEVYEAVKQSPNRRAKYLNVKAWTPEVSRALHELQRMGKVESELVREIGNNESYYIWRTV